MALMQRQPSVIGSVSETLDFGSTLTSSDGGMEHQICWNNQPPAYVVSSDETNISIHNPASQERHNITGLSLGESSSTGSQNHVGQSERKTDHGWSSTMNACPGPSHENRYRSPNIFSLSNVDSNEQMANNSLFSRGSSSTTVQHDLNINSRFEGHHGDDDGDYQIMGCTPAYKFDVPGNETKSSATTSSHPFAGTNDGGSGSLLNDRRISCKRKTFEGHMGQSSGSGSRNNIPINMNAGESSRSEQLNSRLGLTMGGAISESPLDLPAPGTGESSHTTLRRRVNSSHQQHSLCSNLFPTNVNVSTNLNFPSMSAADNNVNPQGQPVVLPLPSRHPSAQARWDLARNSETSSSSSFFTYGERNQESHATSLPRNSSQHPMFTPTTGNISIVGNVTSTSRTGSGSRPHSSSLTSVPHGNTPGRLPEFVRRSLLSSSDIEPGGHRGNSPLLLSSAASRNRLLSVNHGDRQSRSRSTTLLERHLAGATEGTSRLVSEIRNVLDLMRRGESVRLEDLMVLDRSVFFGMADIHDGHRDMRVDVDNMSYEELLALEERIGDVCTGLSEEAILSHLKQHKYICIKTQEPVNAETCCICQEEYNGGEDVGSLECGHDFHRDCIKQWLKHKNLCPVCKTTGLKIHEELIQP